VSAAKGSDGPPRGEANPPAVLVLNCGSSTVKFAAFGRGQSRPSLSGVGEALGTASATIRWRADDAGQSRPLPEADHRLAIGFVHDLLSRARLSPVGIGHRVVHGGETFAAATLVDDAVLTRIEELAQLAPLHNPANALGIRLLRKAFPGLPQVAVFDTAFHQTMPVRAYHYALPPEYRTQFGIRRYGFHGTSHRFVAQAAAGRLGRGLEKLQLIIVHLGNGCSACAIRDGRSVDTSMGLTPSEGMMMGTRSGDVDPMLHGFLGRNAGMSPEDIDALLNRHSGLLGVSGISNDRRQLEQRAQAGDERAALALEMFCFRAAKSILAMAASLDRLDALVFTGGIGENSASIRAAIVRHLALLNLGIDRESNENLGPSNDGRISSPEKTVCLVVPTNEELAIANEVWPFVM
jgi:acetate kinase